jgi:hypothetical protein
LLNEGITMNTRTLLLSSGLALVLATACAPHNDSSSSSDLPTRASAAIPAAGDVKLAAPGDSGASAAHFAKGAVQLQDVPGGATGPAEYYRFTRNLFDGVNLGTGWVLGTVLFIVHLPPTSVVGNVATWGPGSDSLEPAEWRLVVTETSHEAFEYELQGRKKGTTDPFEATLKGTGFGKSHADHGKGEFTLFYDVANKLDPTRLGADDDTGTTSITHDLRGYPRVISVSARPTASQHQWDIDTLRAADGTGTVHVDALDDVSTPKNGTLEHVIFDSHFTAQGSGKAVATLSGGDVPNGLTVHVTECWTPAPAFTRSFYGDDANIEATSGAESACPTF